MNQTILAMGDNSICSSVSTFQFWVFLVTFQIYSNCSDSIEGTLLQIYQILVSVALSIHYAHLPGLEAELVTNGCRPWSALESQWRLQQCAVAWNVGSIHFQNFLNGTAEGVLHQISSMQHLASFVIFRFDCELTILGSSFRATSSTRKFLSCTHAAFILMSKGAVVHCLLCPSLM